MERRARRERGQRAREALVRRRRRRWSSRAGTSPSAAAASANAKPTSFAAACAEAADTAPPLVTIAAQRRHPAAGGHARARRHPARAARARDLRAARRAALAVADNPDDRRGLGRHRVAGRPAGRCPRRDRRVLRTARDRGDDRRRAAAGGPTPPRARSRPDCSTPSSTPERRRRLARPCAAGRCASRTGRTPAIRQLPHRRARTGSAGSRCSTREPSHGRPAATWPRRSLDERARAARAATSRSAPGSAGSTAAASWWPPWPRERAGRATPAGYHLLRRAAGLAGHLGLPLVTLVDTAGADPLPDSEQAGIAAAIAASLTAVLALLRARRLPSCTARAAPAARSPRPSATWSR